MAGPLYTGSFTALVTPFKDGAFDEAAFRKFVDWQITEGTDGLVPCGTTGESPTLSHDEHRLVTEVCIEVAAGRVPVMAGCGSNSTSEAVGLVKHAEEAGANSVLVVTPYYNKPNQEGLKQHFLAVAAATSLPVFIYNIPGRSIVDMTPETMGELAKVDNIVGVKDATADPVRPVMQRFACGADFCQLSGEDATILPFMAQGGHGCISVSSNVAPRLCAQFHDAWAAGDLAKAQEINDQLMPLHKNLFIEPNPQGAKYALKLLGICEEELRLPMVPVAPDTQAKIRDAMVHAGLIS